MKAVTARIAERMDETLTLGYVDYAFKYRQQYEKNDSDIDRLAWFLAATAVYNEKYDLLEQSLLDLLPLIKKPINILSALLDSDLGWQEDTNKLFYAYANKLSSEERKMLYHSDGRHHQQLLY